MKRIVTAYKDLLSIIYTEAPVMVILTFVLSILSGLLAPISIFVNKNVFDGGLAVARGEQTFSEYGIFLVLFVVITVAPTVMSGIVWKYVQPRSLLILRTVYRARMLQKLKTMKYEHFESEASMEIIDKAYNRAEDSARHLWPMYVSSWLSSMIAGIGSLAIIASIRWWLLLTILLPFFLEVYMLYKTNYNAYNELETYWKKERKYSILGWCLRSRDFMKELKAFGNAGYLISVYQKRLNERNREYERYFFRNLREILLGRNITKIASIGNAVILLFLYLDGQMSIGQFIAVTAMMFGGIYEILSGCALIFQSAPMHINAFDFYDKFFKLSEESIGTEVSLPKSFDIEFKDVWFRYPGTDKDILKGLNFRINDGEKVSIVGENGEGKSTVIKLLLGLFHPDKGEIFVGGKKLNDYPLNIRTKIFGPIFQDFQRYSISLRENIGVGEIDELSNNKKIIRAAKKGKVDEFVESFERSYDTLLGRDFESGIDISGGQWQRIAIARAFMGDKPVLLLDEPTSQLDPMAEARLYNEFAEMVENKTAIFITHRLGSTMITDKIFVMYNGKIEEQGTHEELVLANGIYSKMFNAQKQWYNMGDVTTKA